MKVTRLGWLSWCSGPWDSDGWPEQPPSLDPVMSPEPLQEPGATEAYRPHSSLALSPPQHPLGTAEGGRVCGALGLAPCPGGGPHDPECRRVKGTETGLLGRGRGPHPPSPLRSSTRHMSRWCRGCRRFSRQETRPCPHSSLPAGCGWGTCQEPNVRGQSRPVACAFVPSSLRGGSGDFLMRWLVSALAVWATYSHRFFSRFIESCIFTASGD